LWSATLSREELPFAVASCVEHRLDEAKYSTVRSSLSNQSEELFVINGPKKISEIRSRRSLEMP
jgi:hypothetical protein